jgi:hypothetical protein
MLQDILTAQFIIICMTIYSVLCSYALYRCSALLQQQNIVIELLRDYIDKIHKTFIKSLKNPKQNNKELLGKLETIIENFKI